MICTLVLNCNKSFGYELLFMGFRFRKITDSVAVTPLLYSRFSELPLLIRNLHFCKGFRSSPNANQHRSNALYISNTSYVHVKFGPSHEVGHGNFCIGPR